MNDKENIKLHLITNMLRWLFWVIVCKYHFEPRFGQKHLHVHVFRRRIHHLLLLFLQTVSYSLDGFGPFCPVTTQTNMQTNDAFLLFVLQILWIIVYDVIKSLGYNHLLIYCICKFSSIYLMLLNNSTI